MYKRQVVLWASVVFNLGLLFFFKYFNFVTGGLFPVIKLPIGISFFTFQIMSYTIDVYRRSVEPQKNLVKLALYILSLIHIWMHGKRIPRQVKPNRVRNELSSRKRS